MREKEAAKTLAQTVRPKFCKTLSLVKWSQQLSFCIACLHPSLPGAAAAMKVVAGTPDTFGYWQRKQYRHESGGILVVCINIFSGSLKDQCNSLPLFCSTQSMPRAGVTSPDAICQKHLKAKELITGA